MDELPTKPGRQSVFNLGFSHSLNKNNASPRKSRLEINKSAISRPSIVLNQQPAVDNANYKSAPYIAKGFKISDRKITGGNLKSTSMNTT
jgi:hypothetical protein